MPAPQGVRERMMVRQMHLLDREFPLHRPWEELVAEARATDPRCVCSFVTGEVHPACPVPHKRAPEAPL